MIITYQDPVTGNETDLTFDAVVKESHSGDAQITDHPVEVGANVSDHIRPMPVELKIQGIATDRPLIPDNLNPPLNIPLLLSPGRAAAQYALLETFRDTGVLLIRVTTDTKLYRNMVVKRVTTDKDKNTADAIFFNLDMKQIRLVNSQTILLQKTTVNKAKPKVDSGKQANQTADSGVSNQTFLKRATGQGSTVQNGVQAAGNAIVKVVPIP